MTAELETCAHPLLQLEKLRHCVRCQAEAASAAGGRPSPGQSASLCSPPDFVQHDRVHKAKGSPTEFQRSQRASVHPPSAVPSLAARLTRLGAGSRGGKTARGRDVGVMADVG